jgi:hypothetical protein
MLLLPQQEEPVVAGMEVIPVEQMVHLENRLLAVEVAPAATTIQLTLLLDNPEGQE